MRLLPGVGSFLFFCFFFFYLKEEVESFSGFAMPQGYLWCKPSANSALVRRYYETDDRCGLCLCAICSGYMADICSIIVRQSLHVSALLFCLAFCVAADLESMHAGFCDGKKAKAMPRSLVFSTWFISVRTTSPFA